MKNIPHHTPNDYTQLTFFDLPTKDHRICQTCNVSFLPLKQTFGMYCSLVCFHKRPKKTKVGTCLYCGKDIIYPAYAKERVYCSPQCRNIHRNKTYAFKRWHTWEPKEIAYLREHYPDEGSVAVAKALGKTPTQVVQKANRLKIPLNKEAMKRIVNAEAQKYMLAHNPMQVEETRQRMSDWMKNTKEGQALQRKLQAGQACLQRDKPSGYEMKVRSALDVLGIAYEASFVIKTKFIVDIKIDNLIIEADGDYWHGHPRFEPLTERQLKQQQRDAARNKYLTTCGYQIESIWESDFSIDYLKNILHKHNII